MYDNKNLRRRGLLALLILALIIALVACEPWAQAAATTEVNIPDVQYNVFKKYYTEEDVIYLAKVAYCEARGIKSKTEISCVMWTILNRVDKYNSDVKHVVLAPNQFAYRSSAPTISDYGYDLKALARDVLANWNLEKNGLPSSRTLPSDYLWYGGNGRHNRFRNAYRGGSYWNYAYGYYYG